MNLDIIGQLVRILWESPELGAIEVRRGWFGAWTAVRVSKAGHTHAGGGGEHIVVAGRPAPVAPAAEAGGGRREAGGVAPTPTSPLLEIKSPMVGTFYSAPDP